MSEHERRVEPRIATGALQLLVYDNINNILVGTAANLSLHGMLIISNQAIDVGGILQASLRTQHEPEQNLIEMALKISWLSDASTPGSYWLGAQTIGISNPDSKTLETLIEQARTE